VSLTQREKESLRIRGWKTNAKGKGNKWQILRDVVVFCALVPWTTTSIEDAMLLHRGISHRKTYEMLMELERAGALENLQVGDSLLWSTSPKGVKSFMAGKMENIPATLAQAAWTLSGVEKSEESKNEGPSGQAR